MLLRAGNEWDCLIGLVIIRRQLTGSNNLTGHEKSALVKIKGVIFQVILDL